MGPKVMMVQSNDGLKRSLTNMSFLPLFYCCPLRSWTNQVIDPTSLCLLVGSVKLWRQVISTSWPRGVDPHHSHARGRASWRVLCQTACPTWEQAASEEKGRVAERLVMAWSCATHFHPSLTGQMWSVFYFKKINKQDLKEQPTQMTY